MVHANSQRRQDGFTLVELLVVIAVIGILVALLMPAVQAARESARRAHCLNNMKQLALAMHNHHDVYKRFPSAHQIGTGSTFNQPYERELPPQGTAANGFPIEGPYWSWAMRISPYIEMGVLKDHADMSASMAGWPWWQKVPGTNQDLCSVKCPTFICPSAPRGRDMWTDGVNFSSLTMYLAVSGRNQFKEAKGQDGMVYVNSSVPLAAVTDGTSNTLLIGERVTSSTLLYGWQWAGAGDPPYFGATDVVLGVFERPLNPTSNPDYFRLGKTIDPMDLDRYHFWSLHPGGANFALVDGSIRFFSYNAGGPENVSPGVIGAMASRSGDEAVFPD